MRECWNCHTTAYLHITDAGVLCEQCIRAIESRGEDIMVGRSLSEDDEEPVADENLCNYRCY